MSLKANYIQIILIILLIKFSLIQSAALSITNVFKDQRHSITTSGVSVNVTDTEGEDYNIRVHVKNMYIALPKSEKNTTAIQTILQALGLPPPQKQQNGNTTFAYTLVIDNIFTMVDEYADEDDDDDFDDNDDKDYDDVQNAVSDKIHADTADFQPKIVKAKNIRKINEIIKSVL